MILKRLGEVSAFKNFTTFCQLIKTGRQINQNSPRGSFGFDLDAIGHPFLGTFRWLDFETKGTLIFDDFIIF